MKRPKILAVILAGGAGSRLDVLTEQCAKPVVPFAGTYRLIDFPLSNCLHSGISDVWLVEQYEPHGLNIHLANGRPWDLDRLYGGLQILPPYLVRSKGEDDNEATDRSGFAQGNADALYRNRQQIRAFGADLLVVLSSDHLYRLDYREVIDAHLAHADEADVTLVAVHVPREEASRFGNVDIDSQGRVTRFDYKPDNPKSDMATAEVFVYDAPRLLDALEELGNKAQAETPDGESAGALLKDFGHELLPHLVAKGRARAFVLDSYWRDVGTIESFYAAHQDLLSPTPPLVPDDPAWPIRTFFLTRLPARITSEARVTDSLIAPGCHIAGTVIRSVLGPGVQVAAGATVRDAVLFEGVTIDAGAVIERAILDQEVRVESDSRIGGPDAITVVGRNAVIRTGVVLPAGERIRPDEERRS